MKIEIDKKDLSILDSALERSIDDVESYFKFGDPGDNLDDEELARVKALPDEYWRLRNRFQDLFKHADDQPWFTVVLIYPDYIATQYGEEFYIGAAQADDAEDAVPMVQWLAAQANPEECESKDDFAMVAVFEGNCTAVLTRNLS